MKKRPKKKPKRRERLFTEENFETVTTVLAVVTATSSDAYTRLKCDDALKALRHLKLKILSL